MNDKYSELQLDSLKELSNIGMGRAAQALSQIVDKKVNIMVPKAALASIKDAPEVLGGSEKEIACIYMKILGDISVATLLVFERGSALALAGVMLGAEQEERRDITEIDESALKELGNVVVNTYLNVLAEMLNIKVRPSVPYFSLDMLGAVIDLAMIEIARFSNYVLLLDTKIEICDFEIKGNFLIFPDQEALELIFKKLGTS